MSKSTFREARRAAVKLIGTGLILAVSLTGAAAQAPAPASQENVYWLPAEFPAPEFPQAFVAASSEANQLPQDIRIMQRIVSTALGEVEPPELPADLQQASDERESRASSVHFGDTTVVMALPRSGNFFRVGSRDVTGFYMQGYGYLFTVKWQVGPGGNTFVYSEASGARAAELRILAEQARRAATTADATEARAAGDAERALEGERERLEARQAALEEWSAEYRDLLAEELRNVVALYGSTLKRAAPEEAITFIADFGGGEGETVTVSARSGELSGASREQNIAAVRMARGETEISEMQRTELKIMAEIIDTSLQSESSGNVWAVTAERVRFFGGDSSYQYVPGYGVLFRKSARLNLATHVVQSVAPTRVTPGAPTPSLRQRMDESTEDQRQAYAEHLADLKQRTAEILATYGPTLTEMGTDEWVGIYYDVGSAAALLEGGMSNFLVQARMGDIRQAGAQTDGAAFLLDRVVTNERQD